MVVGPSGSDLDPPIFVGGTGRSGTTVVSRLLGRTPNIHAMRWETQFIVAARGLLELAAADYPPDALDAFLTMLRGRWYRRTLNPGKPNEYEAGLCSDVGEEHLEASIAQLQADISAAAAPPLEIAADFIGRLFGEPARAAGARRWLEKTPRNIVYIEQLWQMFPDMRFIHMIRDGRDVAASMMRRQFWPIATIPGRPSTHDFTGEVTLELAAAYWREMLHLGRLAASRIPPENYLEVRLEDLVHSREAMLERICSFLDEPLDESALDFPLDEQRLGGWRDDFADADVDRFLAIAGRELALEGYPT
jgi:hypothetical protein